MSQQDTARDLPSTADDDGEARPFEPVAAPVAGLGDTGLAAAPDKDPSGAGAPADGSVPAQARVPATATPGIADIAMIGNIPVSLSMEIGRTSLTIAELMSLGKGSVVELQRMADEPLDVLVNGTLVAHGEAVVVGDRFGIRLTDVVSADERLGRLG